MAKFFISYNSADSQKAQWIGWVLEKELGHTVHIHEWEISGGDNIPDWMESALRDSNHLIGVFSPDYVDAVFSKSERLSAYWKSTKHADGFLLPIVVRDCELPILVDPINRCELMDCNRDEALTRLKAFVTPASRPTNEPVFQEEPSRFAADDEPLFAPLPSHAKAYDLSNLPKPHSDDLIGRDDEKADLTAEWANRAQRTVVALIAEGGTGKSFLVARWLAELQNQHPAPYAGARRIFTWSFYSQGSQGQVTSSEPFFANLIRSFGEDPDQLDTWAKEAKARELVQAQEMILVLDGVEPLQNPPGHADAGRFYDTILGTFLNRLAGQGWPGLVLITSRQELAELKAMEGQAIRHIDLRKLEPQDGAELLRKLGATGPDDELLAAVQEMSGHAFGLVLLGRYVVEFLRKDIRRRIHAKPLNRFVKGADKAKVMLQAYADHFGADSALTAMLYLLGLFDRPVARSALEALLADEAISGLTEAFHDAEAPPLDFVLNRLEEYQLITLPVDQETGERGDNIDGHPLVREHFGEVLQDGWPQAWRAAQSRLFDYFCALPDQDQPATEATLMPLYQSLHHGVAADRAQEALDEAYYRRIGRSGESFGVKKLGLFGTELAALAPFFQGDWGAPVTSVTPGDQGWLLNLAGFRLRALGRLQEARLTFEQQVARCIDAGDDLNAALNSSNLSELLLTLGDLEGARMRAEDAVRLIDKSNDADSQYVYRTTLADAQAHLGQDDQAADLFADAERRQQATRPNEPYLYSLRGYQYASFLIRRAGPADQDALTTRVEATLAIADRNTWLLAIGLDRLNLAILTVRRGAQGATAQFDTAVAALRLAGQRDDLPRGYLARAGFRRGQGDLPGAWQDLAEVRVIAEPSGMRLFLCDALIQEAWLHHDAGDIDDARAAYEQAKAEVADMHYHMRDPDLADLAEALRSPPE